jgi:hypothetical protein
MSMRAILIAAATAVGLTLVASSAGMAAPANGIVIGKAASGHVEQVHWRWHRHWRWHHRHHRWWY